MAPSRMDSVLKIIVGEYISSALPVASEKIARSYPLGVSPATIRNDMARLEEEGFITQPHTSAGRIPLDKGYRHYVEFLMDDEVIPENQQGMIKRQFHQVEKDMEVWIRLAASILARMAYNLAMITTPKPPEARFKHLELVSIQDFLALLILVLQEARVRQLTIPLEKPTSQDQLTANAHRLSEAFLGLSAYEIAALPASRSLKAEKAESSPLEEQITQAVVRIMEEEDVQSSERPYFEGVRNLLSQPEFASSERVLAVVDVLEEKNILDALPFPGLQEEGVKVIIGRENPSEIMRNCSMVLTHYGVPGQMTGAIGVLGPTRMHYPKVIPYVRFLSQVMSKLVAERLGF